MPEPSEPQLRSASPILQVSDLEAAIGYYQSVLGFQLGWKWGDPATLASVCRDQVEFMLEQRATGADRRIAKAYVQVTGLDKYHAGIAAVGAVIPVPLARRAYGMKDCRVVDPDGNEISFGEPLDGA
jgi:catechol 2,3-dioxygenase-like lactoylglutathione lyase family enzyme